MQKAFYFLSPVEVVKVTSSNLEEVAEWCGGKVAQTESRRVPGRMDSYVWVPTPKGSNISWAFPGMFITKRLVLTMKNELKATWAVFRRDYFEKNYFETPQDAVNKTWELEDRTPKAKKVAEVAPSEPIVEPPASTLDVEQMDDETRERIEQVNRDILKKGLKPSAEAKAIAQQVGQTPEFVQAVIDAPVESTPAQARMAAREEDVENQA